MSKWPDLPVFPPNLTSLRIAVELVCLERITSLHNLRSLCIEEIDDGAKDIAVLGTLS